LQAWEDPVLAHWSFAMNLRTFAGLCALAELLIPH